jgi:hypothetical protein
MRWLLLLIPLLFLGCHGKNKPTEPKPSYVPVAPANLRAVVHVGREIDLFWEDRSDNETHFHLTNGVTADEVVLPANTTTYAQNVGLTTQLFHFRLWAVNDSGSSDAVTLDVNYRIRSDGVIPLAPGNMWRYSSNGRSPASLLRTVHEMQLIHGDDYYLLSDSSLADTTAPSLYYYLRNNDSAAVMLDYPADSTIAPDTLFRYPAIASGQFYTFKQDCMLVLIGPPGSTISIGDSTYTNVIAYQRFLNRNPAHSIQYYFVPQRLGLIRQDEYQSSTRISRLDLMSYDLR